MEWFNHLYANGEHVNLLPSGQNVKYNRLFFLIYLMCPGI